jgi:hypothetical protein
MADHKEITTIEDVIGILEAKITAFQNYTHSSKPDSKNPWLRLYSRAANEKDLSGN